MKKIPIKTFETSGPNLAVAVAIAWGWVRGSPNRIEWLPGFHLQEMRNNIFLVSQRSQALAFRPHEDWAQISHLIIHPPTFAIVPILKKEKPEDPGIWLWGCCPRGYSEGPYGATAAEALCRAFVATRLGLDPEIPDMLTPCIQIARSMPTPIRKH